MTEWIKAALAGFLKRAAIAFVQDEGDKLQAELRWAVACDGDHGKMCQRIDMVVNHAQARIDKAIKTWGPTWAILAPIREKAAAEVLKWGDSLQAEAKKEVSTYGPKAIDRVFDAAQRALTARIEAL